MPKSSTNNEKKQNKIQNVVCIFPTVRKELIYYINPSVRPFGLRQKYDISANSLPNRPSDSQRSELQSLSETIGQQKNPSRRHHNIYFQVRSPLPAWWSVVLWTDMTVVGGTLVVVLGTTQQLLPWIWQLSLVYQTSRLRALVGTRVDTQSMHFANLE